MSLFCLVDCITFPKLFMPLSEKNSTYAFPLPLWFSGHIPLMAGLATWHVLWVKSYLPLPNWCFKSHGVLWFFFGSSHGFLFPLPGKDLLPKRSFCFHLNPRIKKTYRAESESTCSWADISKKYNPFGIINFWDLRMLFVTVASPTYVLPFYKILPVLYVKPAELYIPHFFFPGFTFLLLKQFFWWKSMITKTFEFLHTWRCLYFTLTLE